MASFEAEIESAKNTHIHEETLKPHQNYFIHKMDTKNK